MLVVDTLNIKFGSSNNCNAPIKLVIIIKILIGRSKRDLEKGLYRACAVHLGRFVYLGRNEKDSPSK